MDNASPGLPTMDNAAPARHTGPDFGHGTPAMRLSGSILMSGPLTGVRVLELARILAGPWAGQILADLGADVIKVERPGAGDDTRGWGPPFVEGPNGENLSAAYYHSCTRGKRSVAVDFETERGRRIVQKLAQRSDI